MTQDELKRKTAEAALEYIKDIRVIGVGTGSTVNHFINFLADMRSSIDGAVSSSEGTTARLRQLGIPVIELNNLADVEIYVDGADEVNAAKQMIKGGGGALTREKIIAQASAKFVCIADKSKRVEQLGKFPLPIEVIPMARSFVAREMVKMGGTPKWRENFVTDNGNQIIDVSKLEITDPIAMEKAINDIPGVVTVGLFAIRPADIVLLADQAGIETF